MPSRSWPRRSPTAAVAVLRVVKVVSSMALLPSRVRRPPPPRTTARPSSTSAPLPHGALEASGISGRSRRAGRCGSHAAAQEGDNLHGEEEDNDGTYSSNLIRSTNDCTSLTYSHSKAVNNSSIHTARIRDNAFGVARRSTRAIRERSVSSVSLLLWWPVVVFFMVPSSSSSSWGYMLFHLHERWWESVVHHS